MWEAHPAGDREDFQAAFLDPSVHRPCPSSTCDGDLRPRQRRHPRQELGPVALDAGDPVPSALVEVLGVAVLDMQRVRGHDRVLHIDRVQQWLKAGDLVALPVHLHLHLRTPGVCSSAASRCGVVRSLNRPAGRLPRADPTDRARRIYQRRLPAAVMNQPDVLKWLCHPRGSTETLPVPLPPSARRQPRHTEAAD